MIRITKLSSALVGSVDSLGGSKLRFGLSFRTYVVAALAAMAATAVGCFSKSDDHPFVDLVPVATSEAPLSENSDVALVTENVACVVDSYLHQIHCGHRTGEVVGVFGNKGQGPGEFGGHMLVERGPGGVLGVVDVGLARLTLFEPSGTLLSDTPMPSGFTGHKLVGNRLFGSDFATFFASTRPASDGFNPGIAEVDARSGSVVWRRASISDVVETECGRVGLGWPSPGGGYVFWACDHELVFLESKDAPSATVVASPTYFEELPTERDVDAYRSDLMSLAGNMSAAMSAMEPYLTRFRERPKKWFLTSDSPFGFDSLDRLWVAITRDRETFSYFDIWIGTEYVGTVRIRDRLIGFDLLESTLVVLVERVPGPNGIAWREIDWYRIDALDFE